MENFAYLLVCIERASKVVVAIHAVLATRGKNSPRSTHKQNTARDVALVRYTRQVNVTFASALNALSFIINIDGRKRGEQ